MFLLFGVGVFMFAFVFRRLYFRLLIAMFFTTLRMYVFAKKQFTSTVNKIKHTCTTNKANFSIAHYKVVYNEKAFNINIVNMKGENRKLKMDDLRHCLRDKNKIVHCSVINDSGDVILDATKLIREFVLYFNSDTEESKVKYFMAYLEDIHDTSLLNFKLMVYLNDEYFTERVYELMDIQDTFYRDIFV